MQLGRKDRKKCGMADDIYIYIHEKILCIYIYMPGTCLSSILGVEPSKTRPFSSKTRVIWVPGVYTYTYSVSTIFKVLVQFQTVAGRMIVEIRASRAIDIHI